MKLPITCTTSFEDVLKDMGCDEKTIEQILSMDADGNKNGILRVLATHRQRLLDTVHVYEKQISCLDYYVYYIKKGGENES